MASHISLKRYILLYGTTVLGTFFLSVVFSHGYAMSNLVGNNDALGIISGTAGATTSSGRWFLDVLVRISKFLFGNVYFLPWFNLLLGFMFIACAAFLILYLFQVKLKEIIVLVTSLMIVFPATTSMALYGFTFHFNMFSLLLAVISGIILCKQQSVLSNCFSVFLIVLSLGIYQAYLPLTCGILVLFQIKMLCDGCSCKTLIYSIVRCGAAVLFGVFLYFVLTKVFCMWHHVLLSNYKGIDQMTKIPSLKSFFLSIIYAYGVLLTMPIKNPYGFSAFLILRIFIFVYYVLSFVVAFHLFKKISEGSKKIMFILLLLLLPLASNSIFFMVGGDRTAVYAAMLYGMIAVFLFLPLFLPYEVVAWVKKQTNCFILSGLVICWGWYNNGVYTTSHHVIEQNIAVWNRIIMEIESLEEYQPQMSVCILGEQPNIPSVAEQYECFSKLAALQYVNDWALPHFLRNYLGWEKDFISTVPELPKEFPVYPDKGSIVIIDDIVVIHFSSY